MANIKFQISIYVQSAVLVKEIALFKRYQCLNKKVVDVYGMQDSELRTRVQPTLAVVKTTNLREE